MIAEKTIHEAVGEKNLSLLVSLLNKGAAVDVLDDQGRTPLHITVSSNYKSGVESLLASGANVNLQDNDGNTSLHLAGDIAIIKALIIRGADVRAKNKHKKTPLHLFAVKDNDAGLKLLLDTGAKVNARDKDGNAALHDAASTDCSKAVKMLLHNGAKIGAKNKYGSTAVNVAATNDSCTSLKLLIEAGADVNVKERNCNSPLHNAAGASYETIRVLLHKGADVTAKNRYKATPMHVFAAKGNHIGIKLLIKAGAEINVAGKQNTTALHNVVYNLKYVMSKISLAKQLEPCYENTSRKHHFKLQDYYLCFDLLIKAGALVNVETVYGATPLHFAICSGNCAVVKTLVDRGANLEIYYRAQIPQNELIVYNNSTTRYPKGLRPLHISVLQDDPSCLKVLLEAGALVNTESDSDTTPLHLAAGRSEIKITKTNHKGLVGKAENYLGSVSLDLLLEAGANISKRNAAGGTPLHDAGRYGNIETMKTLIQKGVDLEAKDNVGLTALHIAARGHPSCVQLLLDSGANVNVKSEFYETPVHIAAESGIIETVRILLDKGADCESKNLTGTTPLHYASCKAEYDQSCAEVLLQAGSKVNVVDVHDNTPLHCASDRGCPKTVKTLIEKGAELEVKNSEGMTPLLIASSYCDILWKTCVEVLLEAGAEVNVQDSYGKTPLHNVAHTYFSDIIKTIISKGAELEARNKGGLTPLLIASGVRDLANESCVAIILEAGAEVNVQNPYRGNTPLHYIAHTDRFDIMRTLIEKGAELEASNKRGFTPLHAAATKCYVSCISLLLEAGAKVNVKDVDGNTPLFHAITTGSYKAVEALVDRGADLEAINKIGLTPLLKAASCISVLELNRRTNVKVRNFTASEKSVKDYNNIIELLIQKGANLDVKDKFGSTPLHLVASHGDRRSVEIFLEARADINAKDFSGNTPLHKSAQFGNIETVHILLSKGAHLEAKNKEEKTPLNLHCSSQRVYNRKSHVYLNVLLRKGAKVNVRDKRGFTPLHWQGHYHRTKILLKHGACINAETNGMDIPLATAASHIARCDDRRTFKELLYWGASVNDTFNEDKHNFKPCVYVCLKEYNIMLKSANLDKTITQKVVDCRGLETFQISCCEEIKRLKLKKCGEADMYSLLSLCNHQDPVCVGNVSLEQLVNAPHFEREFPVYTPLLKVIFQKAKRRYNLLNAAQKYFETPIPNEIKRKILSYLSEEDLTNVIESAKIVKIAKYTYNVGV